MVTGTTLQFVSLVQAFARALTDVTAQDRGATGQRRFPPLSPVPQFEILARQLDERDNVSSKRSERHTGKRRRGVVGKKHRVIPDHAGQVRKQAA